jgi:hypothetical protein
MLYALLCYNNEAAVCGLSRDEDEAMMARVRGAEAKILEKGRFGPRLRLMPTTAATFVKAGKDPLVIDGPFSETKEQLLGFWVLDCASLEEAIEAGKHLAREREFGGIEIRPISAYVPSETEA